MEILFVFFSLCLLAVIIWLVRRICQRNKQKEQKHQIELNNHIETNYSEHEGKKEKKKNEIFRLNEFRINRKNIFNIEEEESMNTSMQS